jgi:hypothetical protein
MERMISCEQAKKVDLVEFLDKLGYQPQKIRNSDYWYLSPFRQEKTPSFKVNTKLNVWFDFGGGQGGNLVDFGIQYFRCSVSELLQRIKDMGYTHDLSFHQHLPLSASQPPQPGQGAGEKKENEQGKIVVLEAGPLSSPGLIQYLENRQIPFEIAQAWCHEVAFELYGKKYLAIGFQNSTGGYELRSENFKGSSSPKDCTFIENKQESIAVFEGFFSFLSFQTLVHERDLPLTNYLVLNSLAFFQKARSIMDPYGQVQLYLDSDPPGRKHTLQALQWDKEKYIDHSHFYKGHKDLNDWLIERDSHRQQVTRKGRRL